MTSSSSPHVVWLAWRIPVNKHTDDWPTRLIRMICLERESIICAAITEQAWRVQLGDSWPGHGAGGAGRKNLCPSCRALALTDYLGQARNITSATPVMDKHTGTHACKYSQNVFDHHSVTTAIIRIIRILSLHCLQLQMHGIRYSSSRHHIFFPTNQQKHRRVREIRLVMVKTMSFSMTVQSYRCFPLSRTHAYTYTHT